MASSAVSPLPFPPDAASRPAVPPRDRLAAINGLLDRSWSRGWLSRPTLDADALLARARRVTGLADAGGDTGWQQRLEVLTAALEQQAALTPLGRTIAHGQLVAALANRLRAHALWRRHPEIMSVPLRAPVIVLGQMRSGSTRMQRLLACDPRLACTRFFESWNPLPRNTLFDDRRLRTWIGLRLAGLINPAFAAIHPTGVAAPDEEIGLHSVAIFGSAFEAQWRVPAFAAHVETSDATPAYREVARLLRTMLWLRRDGAARPLILKVPQMTQDLDAVLRVFPDARLVCLHRDPAAIVASSASLAYNQMRCQSDDVDRAWIGREWLRKTALRHARTAAVRARASVPQVDVAYDAIEADWEGEMARVYRTLQLPLTRDVRTRMADYVAGSRGDGTTPHAYHLEEYGLTPAEVAAAFTPPGDARAAA